MQIKRQKEFMVEKGTVKTTLPAVVTHIGHELP